MVKLSNTFNTGLPLEVAAASFLQVVVGCSVAYALFSPSIKTFGVVENLLI
jgi:hypothetical protein